MSIRRGDADDAWAAAEIVALVAPEGTLGAQPPVDVAAYARRIAEALAPGEPSAIWVVDAPDGRIGGYLALSPSRTPGVLSLAMVLRPEARGRGYGRELLTVALAHGRGAEDAHKLELEVWTDNARAIALYAAMGFDVEGVRRDHYRRRDGRLRSTLIMAARLD